MPRTRLRPTNHQLFSFRPRNSSASSSQQLTANFQSLTLRDPFVEFAGFSVVRTFPADHRAGIEFWRSFRVLFTMYNHWNLRNHWRLVLDLLEVPTWNGPCSTGRAKDRIIGVFTYSINPTVADDQTINSSFKWFY